MLATPSIDGGAHQHESEGLLLNSIHTVTSSLIELVRWMLPPPSPPLSPPPPCYLLLVTSWLSNCELVNWIINASGCGEWNGDGAGFNFSSLSSFGIDSQYFYSVTHTSHVSAALLQPCCDRCRWSHLATVPSNCPQLECPAGKLHAI